MAETAALRAEALRLFGAAIQAADPEAAVASQLARRPIAAAQGGKSVLIAFGKAAPAMARAALSRCSFDDALVVTHHENAQDVAGAELMTAGHPVPDAAGICAADAIISKLKLLGPADHVLALVSGGASALLPAPPEGVSLEDKQELSRLLLGSGLSINDMNLIRQSVSRLKGGGFLRHAAPAKVTAFILSDVIGDDLRAIASGPTVAPLGTAVEARELLRSSGLWERVPAPVQAHLAKDRSEEPMPQNAENILIGSNGISLQAMLREVGSGARIVNDHLVGDVADAAQSIASAAMEAPIDEVTLIWGGETTVQIKGTGLGGRNQELAVRVAARLASLDRPWVFLSGGTDGRDGPTDAAGGLVDGRSLARMNAAGCDFDALLRNNDSNALLSASKDLVITGATGTNVADVQILILG